VSLVQLLAALVGSCTGSLYHNKPLVVWLRKMHQIGPCCVRQLLDVHPTFTSIQMITPLAAYVLMLLFNNNLALYRSLQRSCWCC
jgi:hypothetical protein